MANPLKSRATYMRHYRDSKRHQIHLEELLQHNDGSISEGQEDEPITEEDLDEFRNGGAVGNSNDENRDSEAESMQTAESDTMENRSHESDDSYILDYLTFDNISNENVDHGDTSSSEDNESFVGLRQQLKTKDFLCEWAIKTKPSVDALNSLLRHLHDFMPMIPKTGITLKETVYTKHVTEFCGGQYQYLGMKQAINEYLKMYSHPCKLDIIVNIDGVRCYRSKKKSFWPILALINETGPFLISVWYGLKKPNNVDLFLADFLMKWSYCLLAVIEIFQLIC